MKNNRRFGLSLLLLATGAACSFQAFTSAEEIDEGGQTLRLNVDVLFNRETNYSGSGHFCLSLPSGWADPQVSYSYGQNAVQTASAATVEFMGKVAEVGVPDDSQSWRCFSSARESSTANDSLSGTAQVDIAVPEGFQGVLDVWTLSARWNSNSEFSTLSPRRQRLRVGAPAVDTFEKWAHDAWLAYDMNVMFHAEIEGTEVLAGGYRFAVKQAGESGWRIFSAPNNSEIYGLLAFDGRFIFSTSAGLQQMTESGREWTLTSLRSLVNSMAVFQGRLFVSPPRRIEVLEGENWILKTTSQDRTSLSASDDEILAFEESQSIRRSTDGETWTTIVPPVRFVSGVWGNGRWLALSADGLLYASTDGGLNWSKDQTLDAQWSASSIGYADGRFLLTSSDFARVMTGSGSSGWVEVVHGFTGALRFSERRDTVWALGSGGFIGRAAKLQPEQLAIRLPLSEVQAEVGESFRRTIPVEYTRGATTLTASNLPPGLELDGFGLLSGTFTTRGSYPVVFTASDSTERSATHQVHFRVRGAMALESGSLGLAPKTVASEKRIPIIDGYAPFEINELLAPEGITARVEGEEIVVSFPAGLEGEVSFTVSVKDSEEARAEGAFTLTVVDAPLIGAEAMPRAVVGESYSYSLGVEGEGGPFVWSLEGELPAGLGAEQVEGDYVVSGSPGASGLFELVFVVSDSLGQQTRRTETLQVIAAPVLSSEAMPQAKVGEAYEFVLGVSGEGPFTWSPEGELPAGLAWSEVENGRKLSGTPTAEGSFSFEISVTDANELSASITLALVVKAADPVDPEPQPEPQPETPADESGCGGCNASSATSMLALLALGLLGRRRRE